MPAADRRGRSVRILPSFPSGHTLNAVVIAYLLMLRQTTRRARVLTGTVAILFALTIGLSRVYLGHYWFIDVLVAVTLGLVWLAIIITAHRLYLASRQRRTRMLASPRTGRE
ncbi:phosphatase PAP2 family protein [Cryobacterium sp. Hh38]|uniref:phosphatase PAP2 family protein n=1 Tax=Cryobacterium sp. Hh38 TaxID=1259156 RepID=UPI001F53E951|nr:phosphatase PAP2 family protein [Cryobacterium sp. Hh38]